MKDFGPFALLLTRFQGDYKELITGNAVSFSVVIGMILVPMFGAMGAAWMSLPVLLSRMLCHCIN